MKRIANFFACQLYRNGQHLIIIATAAYIYFTQEFNWETILVSLATFLGLAFLYGVLVFFLNQPTPVRRETWHDLEIWKCVVFLFTFSMIALITMLATVFLLAAYFQVQLTEYSVLSLFALIFSIVFFTAESFIFKTRNNTPPEPQ